MHLPVITENKKSSSFYLSYANNINKQSNKSKIEQNLLMKSILHAIETKPAIRTCEKLVKLLLTARDKINIRRDSEIESFIRIKPFI
jgi:CRISPR/Cas system CSM-associated protein Csm2 small subunit